MATLKKCPFCGGKSRLILYGADRWIKCQNCYATSREYSTEAEAIAAWNRRADEQTFTSEEIEEIGSWFFRVLPNNGQVSDIRSSILRKCLAALKGGAK